MQIVVCKAKAWLLICTPLVPWLHVVEACNECVFREPNHEALRLVREMKLRETVPLMRMYRNRQPTSISHRVFACDTFCGFWQCAPRERLDGLIPSDTLCFENFDSRNVSKIKMLFNMSRGDRPTLLFESIRDDILTFILFIKAYHSLHGSAALL